MRPRRGAAEVAGEKPLVRRNKNGAPVPATVDFGPLAGWVGFNLRMAQEAAFQAFSRRSQEIGESPGRFATLMLIGRNPGISQTELSHTNGRDKTNKTQKNKDQKHHNQDKRKRMD